MERRLAAILIADVVGYARHSRTDEEGTRERFNADLHDLIEPTIASYSGRLVKTMGDGILAEFKSVVDATRCAIEWQTKKSQNRSTDALVFRIGINIGDIIIEPPDIHGDGVNLAARLQTLANPGGIALSGPAYDQVQSKISARFNYIGPRTVKSIPDPVRVYLIDLLPAARRQTLPRISARHLAAAASLASALLIGSAAWHGLGSRSEAPDAGASSMAVLPFANMSDDAQQGHLADGITEDLTTELAQVPGLFITSRSAAFAYRDKNVSPQEVAKTLGVHYILEGSVRRMGNDLRVTAQLIDAETNGHIWANRYDGTWDDVFTVQDKIVSEIAGTLRLKLAAARQGAAMAGGTRNPAAYEAYLMGKSLLKSSNPGDWQSAVDAYKEALKLDANFGAAAAEIAWIYHDATGSRLSALGVDLAEARELEVNYLAKAQQHPSAAYHQLMGINWWRPNNPPSDHVGAGSHRSRPERPPQLSRHGIRPHPQRSSREWFGLRQACHQT